MCTNLPPFFSKGCVMPDRGLLSVHAFAKLSRTTPATLHHYDRIGILSPYTRGKNKYRYYTSGQLSLINMIRTLQKLGMSLDEIRLLKNLRTPENINYLLNDQVIKIDRQIKNWIESRDLLLTVQKTIRSCLQVDENAIRVKHLPAEAIILGNINDYSARRNDYDALLQFYRTISDKYPELDLNYPVWGFFSEERIKSGDWHLPDRYYFYNPQGHDKRPAGLYVIAYARGGYGKTDYLYTRCLNYIDENKLEICGNIYEEYPLNEFCIVDETRYLIRVLIPVRKKSASSRKN